MDIKGSEDIPAFGTLVELHGRELFVYLWRMLGNEQDAEDCLQEAFLKAYRGYPSLKSYANIRAWLYRIAGNQARSHLRSRKVRNRREIDLRHVAPEIELSTAEVVDRNLLLREVRLAVENLPLRQRQALILRKYQELAYAEIALVLGSSAPAARANVYQALGKLRARFAQDLAREERT